MVSMQALGEALAPSRRSLLEGSRCNPPGAATVRFPPSCGVLHEVYGHFLLDGAFVFFLVADAWRQADAWGRPVVLLPRGASPYTAHFARLFEGEAVAAVKEVAEEELQSPSVGLLSLRSIGPGFNNVGQLGPDLCKFREFSWRRLLGAAPAPPRALTFLVRRSAAGGASFGHGAGRRWLDNEEAVAELLEAAAATRGLAFERCAMETLTLAEQCAAFARSAVVVAQHGSGLINAVWMQPGAAVVELGAPTADNCFQSLAVACGLRWTASSAPGPWKGGLNVSLEDLSQDLEEVSSVGST